jgi:phosphoadenosine phosphosulfate reductase
MKAPHDLLKEAVDNYPNIALACSFGKDSTVVLHMVRQIKPDIRVFYINTGKEFPETLEFLERMRNEWNLNLEIYDANGRAENLPEDLYLTDPGMCCGIRKIEPTKEALKGADAWITGLRASETKERIDLKQIEEQNAPGFPKIKINPLAHWTEEQVWDYIKKNNIPYHPLYDKGYRSIGCKPCTIACKWGVYERAGRWAGTDKKECGMHFPDNA